MQSIVFRKILLASTLIAAAFSANADKESYQIVIDSYVDTRMGALELPVSAYTEIAYTWDVKGQVEVLYFDSLMVKVIQNGQLAMHNFMSASQFTDLAQTPPFEVAFEEANPDLQLILRDSFSKPICRIDRSQSNDCQVEAAAGAIDLVISGSQVNAMIFHPQKPQAAKKWSSPMQMSLGNGGFATGSVTYVLDSDDGKREFYRVNGTLTSKPIDLPASGYLMKDVVYKVAGTQAFNKSTQRWETGELVYQVSYALDLYDGSSATASGEMKLAFKALN